MQNIGLYHLKHVLMTNITDHTTLKRKSNFSAKKPPQNETEVSLKKKIRQSSSKSNQQHFNMFPTSSTEKVSDNCSASNTNKLLEDTILTLSFNMNLLTILMKRIGDIVVSIFQRNVWTIVYYMTNQSRNLLLL